MIRSMTFDMGPPIGGCKFKSNLWYLDDTTLITTGMTDMAEFFKTEPK